MDSRLDKISTQWPMLRDAGHFVVRYGPAVRKYLEALLRDPHDVEEVAQEFLLKVVERGFENANPDRGRFRDYLKVSVRNAALTHLRRKPRAAGVHDLDELSAPPEAASLDREWLDEWRCCILDRSWHALEAHQRRAPDSLFHTVLRLSVDHPDEDSKRLAARAAKSCGHPLTPEAFRKQLSRARRHFAELLVAEVAQTLQEPSPERVEEELAEVGLIEYVRDYLRPGTAAGDAAP